MTAAYPSFPHASGRLHWPILIVLLLLGLGLYLYSERIGPPPAQEPAVVPQDQLAGEQPEQDREENADAVESGSVPLRPTQGDTDVEPRSSAPGSSTPAPASSDLSAADASLHLEMASGLKSEQREWLVRDRLIERVVVTINGLDGDGVPLRLRPLTHVPGLPALEADGDQWRLPATSDPRYQPYRDVLESLDPDRLVALYFEHQMAFEQAWAELGMVGTDFQSRLIEVIDHLLAFEPPEQAPQLIRPEVLYEFSDPLLEQASWGHKLLIRIGPEHSEAVQRKLAEVRQRLLREAENDVP